MSAAAQGASKTIITRQPPNLKSLIGVATSTIHLTGVTERGPIGQVQGPSASWSTWKRIYGGLISTSYLPIAVWAIFRAPRGLKRIWTTRITHYTDPDDRATTIALAGTANLSGATVIATAGASTSVNTPTFNIESGQTLDVHCDEDGGGPDTATFTGTAAKLVGGAYGVVTAGDIVFKCDGDPDNQTVTFAGGEAVAAAAQLINDNTTGMRAIVVGGATIDLESDTEGTDSRIEIVSDTTGTAAEIGHVSPSVDTGGGNVGNVDAVTFTELKTIVEAAVVNPVTGVTVSQAVTLEPIITSNTTGALSSIQVEATSTAVGFGFDNLKHDGVAGSTVTVIVVDERNPAGLAITLDVEDPTSGVADEFKLKVYKDTELMETWDDLSMTTTASNFHETILNNEDTGSEYIVTTDQAIGSRPDNVTGSALAGGDDGLTGLVDADFIGDAGIRSTKLLPDYIALRAIPGRATAVVQPDLVNWCEETNSFAVLGGPMGETVAGIRTYVKTTAALKGQSEYGAFYWPNVYIANPDEDVYGDTAQKVLVPVEGSQLAAILVQDWKRGGVYEAAGGLENGTLPGVVDIETDAVYDVENRDKLYPDRINIIHHDADGEPFYCDGSRTLKEDGPFPGIGQSRGVIFITQTVKTYADPKRHQNITLRLLGEMRNSITLFLNRQAQLGAFFTDDPDRAFYVDTSENVNPASERAAHRLHVVLGLNMAEQAEWIIIEATKDTRALFEELGL